MSPGRMTYTGPKPSAPIIQTLCPTASPTPSPWRSGKLVVVPIVLFVLVFLLRSGPGVEDLLATEIRSLFAWAVVFALWAVVVIGREILAFSVDTMHLRGLRREAETGQRYRIPAARQGLVKVKNCLVMFDIVPVGLLVLALILSLTI